MVSLPYMKSGVAQSQKCDRTMQVAALATDFTSWFLLSIRQSDSNICPPLLSTA